MFPQNPTACMNRCQLAKLTVFSATITTRKFRKYTSISTSVDFYDFHFLLQPMPYDTIDWVFNVQ